MGRSVIVTNQLSFNPISGIVMQANQTNLLSGICRSAALALLFTLFIGCYSQTTPPQNIAAVPVIMKKVVQEDVQLYNYYTGKTDSVSVQIVPRIRGYLEECTFHQGEIVEEGQVLYKIEQFDYINNVDNAKAKLAIAKAKAANCKADYDRNLELQKKGQGFTTQADLDKTKALWEEAVGQIASAEATLREEEKQLERTVIKAPVRGKISRTMVDPGNLVDGTAGNPPVLATINNLDPIQVYFQVTDSEFNALMTSIRHALGDIRKKNPAYKDTPLIEIARKEKLNDVITFQISIDGINEKESYPFKGYIDYNDNYIDLSTGTNTVRGLIDNPSYTIYPGNICKIRINSHHLKNAILVDKKAICHDLNNKFVWVVDEKNMPSKRVLQLGRETEDGRQIVLSGLKAGETYITEGVLKVRGGVPVTEFKQKAESADKADAENATVKAPQAEKAVEAPKAEKAVEAPQAENTPAPAESKSESSPDKVAPAVKAPENKAVSEKK